ncbi:helix-turn-helix domain-containing protein [Paenibacillus sp. GCM10027626]|uniref:helix-turn-helix domain-containing protein n=1 Tax=Paenibacillus sp. GCM10027626 TaxID=3273411 RepID=UPI00363A9A49
MRKTWFSRLLFSYLPVFFAISLSLLLITYLTLSEMSKKSAVQANEMLSQNIMQRIDNQLKIIDELMLQQLLHNEKIRKFFSPTAPAERMKADFEAAEALTELTRSNKLISSVYLYRTSDYMVLTPTSYTRIENFGDKKFIGSHVNSSLPFRWETSRPYRPYPEQDMQASHVFSLVKYGNLASGSLMVVNVNVEIVSKLIRAMSGSGLQYVELLDETGQVIASKDADNPAAGAGNERLSKPNEGKQLSSVHSAYTGWSIRSGIYDSNALAWVSSLFYVWILFGFAVIAAGIVWLFYVTRRNYKPIQAIVQRISSNGGSQDDLTEGNKVDELQFIETAVEGLLNRSSLLQEQNKENLVFRRSHVFLRLLDEGHSFAHDAETWKKELERIGIDPRCSGLIAVIVEIDKYSDFCSAFNRRDQYLYKHVLLSVNSEMNENESYRVWSEWMNERQLVSLYLLKEPAQDEEVARAKAEKLRVWVEQQLPFTITAGIGTYAADFGKAADSYRNAAELLTYKASLGCNRILARTDLASRPRGEPFRQLPRIRAICQAYRSNDAAWEEEFAEMRRLAQLRLFSRNEISSLFHHLIDHLHKEMTELPEKMQALWDGTQVELYRIVAHQELADDMFESFRSALASAFERMREKRESKSNKQLIRRVKQYIHDHYVDPDLSLARLSKEFGLGGSYMSRLFKEEFGVKFIDYVTQVRVEQAITMLKETQKTVQEIAESVGYVRTMTFIHVFKKITGTTPGSYRKSLE